MPGYLIPVKSAIGDAWPLDILALAGEDSDIYRALAAIGLERLAFLPPSIVQCTVVLPTELALELPGLAGTALVIGSRGDERSAFSFSLGFLDPFRFHIDAVPIRLRFPRSLLKPATEGSDSWEVSEDETEFVEIGISPSLTVSGDGGFQVDGLTTIEISPIAIGDTRMVLVIPTIELFLDEHGTPPPGMEAGDRGVYIAEATLHLPPEIDMESVSLRECSIGSGGFNGRVRLEFRLEWDEDRGAFTAESDMAGSLAGMSFGLRLIEVAFVQNALESARLQGEIKLPFFERRFGADLGFTLGGDFTLALTGVGDGERGADGLFTLAKEDVLSLTCKSIGVEKHEDIVQLVLSGKLKPLLGGLDWPALEVERLSIGSDGSVDVEGGWLNLPRQYALDFHGFRIDLRELGFGTEEEGARQWFGLSGGITLVDGLPISASVEGLKFSWNAAGGGDVAVELRGIAVSFEVPGVLKLQGSVTYEHLDGSGPQGLEGDLFKGRVNIDLTALKTRVAGELMIGKLRTPEDDEFTVVYVTLEVKLPTAIPLGPTGMGIWELQGLFGMHAGPTRSDEQSWYEWYKGGSGDAAYSIASVTKWQPAFGESAFGAGLLIGTQPDDGFSVSLGALVVVLIPGPVIMIEGTANVLQNMPGSRKQEGAFHALAVFDGREGFFQLNVDVQYDIEGILTIAGGMEAFFDFHDPNAWYFHLGQKEPESKRIQANILSLFKVNTYLMVDPRSLATGAAGGFDLSESYGPLTIKFVLKLGYDAAFLWDPFQVDGSIFLLGDIAVLLFGIGIQLYFELQLEAHAPTPYRVAGRAAVKLSLPGPLPPIEAEVEFLWEEPIPPEPVQPYLKGAAMVHHKLANVGWELAESRESMPLVPVDARPVLRFARPLHGRSGARDETGAFALFPPDQIDEWEIEYRCTNAELVADPGGAEILVKEMFPSDIQDEVTAFDFAADSLIPGQDAQEPVWQLWKHTAWDRMPQPSLEILPRIESPCTPSAMHCIRFGEEPPAQLGHVFVRDGVVFIVDFAGNGAFIGTRDHFELGRALQVATAVTIRFPRPVGWIAVNQSRTGNAYGFVRGERFPISASPPNFEVDARAKPFDTIRLEATYPLARDVVHPDPGLPAREGIRIESICYRLADEIARESRDELVEEALAEGAGGAPVLRPDTTYRLRVWTSTEVRRDGHVQATDATKDFYFHTAAGPGTNGSPGEGDRAWITGPLDSLSSYIDDTIPRHGARDAFFGYDVAIAFNEPYVQRMYREPLHIELRDLDDTQVGVPEGTWTMGLLPLLPAGLVTWRAAAEQGGCGAPHESPGAAMLGRKSPSELRPRRRYRATVITAGASAPLHELEFATSRYRDVSALLRSGLVLDADRREVQPVRVIDAPGLSAPDLAGARAAHVALRDARGDLVAALAAGDAPWIVAALARARLTGRQLEDVMRGTFDELDARLLAATARRPWPLPPVFEVLSCAVIGSARVLLLESPEPVPWIRLAVTASTSGTVVPSQLVWNGDGTRAFVIGEVAWPAPPLELMFSLRAAEQAELPPLMRAGTAVEETVRLALT